MRKAPPGKIDFRKTLKPLYTAKSTIEEVQSGRGTFLAIDGSGRPAGPAFQQAIEKIYSLAYTLKFALKQAGTIDFGVPCLECLYTSPDPSLTPPDKWTWTFLLRIPDSVTARQVAAARARVKERRGLDTADVERRALRGGRCLQTLHVGPYDQVAPVYNRLLAHAAQAGLRMSGPPHEVYVSDPHRVPPAKLKTIVRLAVRPATR